MGLELVQLNNFKKIEQGWKVFQHFFIDSHP